MSQCIVYRPEDLLPGVWRSFLKTGPVRAFNPGLLRDRDGWLFVYRVVGSDGLRRIGLCKLDAKLKIIAGSQRPLTDLVRFPTDHRFPEIATRWFADPRLYRFGERVFVYWNSGWHEPQNHQFLQELDPHDFTPVGSPRELVLNGPRQKLEKNWTLFSQGSDEFYAVYSILPHRVLRFSLAGEGPIQFAEHASTEWNLHAYPPSHGGLRGGAPPALVGGKYWSFCHSVHDSADGYRYAVAAYCFSGAYPFSPTDEPIEPLACATPLGAQRVHEKLNPAVGEVIYPCGAIHDAERWLVSHGINDERCAITLFEDGEVGSSLRPLQLSS